MQGGSSPVCKVVFEEEKTSRRITARRSAGSKNSYAAECRANLGRLWTQTTLIKNIINLENVLSPWRFPQMGPWRFIPGVPKTDISLKSPLPITYDVEMYQNGTL